MSSLAKFMQPQTQIDMAEKKKSAGRGGKLSVAQGIGLSINAV